MRKLIGSGLLQRRGKVAIGTRLKHAGMHGTLRGANAIIALRCAQLSGRFEDFYEMGVYEMGVGEQFVAREGNGHLSLICEDDEVI